MKRKLAAILLPLTLVAGLMVAGAAPAQAAPCSSFTDIRKSETWGYCAGDPTVDRFRAWVSCYIAGFIPYTALGEWEPSGGGKSSHAKCPGDYHDSGVDEVPGA
jgi:hypothetical protein